jgi:hypothetical protein
MILLNKKAIKSYQSVKSQGNLGFIQPAPKQHWPTGSKSQKFAIIIWPLMKIQKRKFWNGLKPKQKVQANYTYRPSALCEAKYPRFVNRGWVEFFILRHRDDLTKIKNIPQEDPRLKIPRVFLDEIVRRLREYVQGMKAE